MASQTGRCNCGSITVSISAVPSVTAACHCVNCRRAGGPFSMNYVIDENEVTVNDPKQSLKEYQDSNTVTGNTVRRHFCQTCGSPIYSLAEKLPGKFFVKASLFDDVVKARMDLFPEQEIKWE